MSSEKTEPHPKQDNGMSAEASVSEKVPLKTITPLDEVNPPKTTAQSSENEYESEPASLRTFIMRKKRRAQFNDGKTMHPKVTSISREVRELAKKQFELDKNLKIDGIPDPPKIRKRRMSVGSSTGRDRDPVYCKRKRLNSLDARPKKDHMPKWGLLGGDASDPLNLNGLATSEEGRLLNLKTPENSPLPTPDFRKIVYVKVPPNIEDPLNLEGKHDQRVIDMLLNATRKKRHRGPRAKKNKDNLNPVKDLNPDTALNSSVSEEKVVKESATKPSEDSSLNQKPVIVSQSSNAKPRSRSISMSPERRFKRQISGGKGVKQGSNEPNKFPEKPKFTLGNYNRYYGYRNQDCLPDPRLRYFNAHWFDDKDVLDIGCNVGHVTLALAEQFSPHKILGMDIDGKLIAAARQNIRHMLSQRRKDSSKYPSVFEITRGPLEAHPLMGSSNSFPNNVLFLQGNYVPGSIEILNLQKEEYDTILALSITKWIHLNNGDHGLKLFFQKIFRQLRPGGRLILEPQPLCTYKKRAKLSPELFKNYSSIKLKPEGFKNYLLSIGFVKCEVIGVPVTKAKGFRRPLILFTKADKNSSIPALRNQSESSNNFRVCTECPDGDQTMCDHVHSTGMRQGAYADRLYDHISYSSSLSFSVDSNKCLSFPSPLLPATDNCASRKDSPYVSGSSLMVASPYGPYSSDGSRRSATYARTPTFSSCSSGIGGQPGSDRSWTSDSSGSSVSHSSSSSSLSHSSSSSYSDSSSSSSSRELVNGLDDGPVNNNGGGNYSPELNGGLAEDILWVDNENANMEPENVLSGDEIEENGAGEPINGGLLNGNISSEEG